jgi:rod shape-determining protein MreD
VGITNSSFIKGSKKKYSYYFFMLVAITIFHIVFIDFIEIMEITPDLFIILVVWITLKEGRFTGLLTGFAVGLFLDVISADIIGTNALAKTIAAFIASFFYKENNTIQFTKSYKFILIVLLSAFVHNIIYYFFFINASDQSFFLFYLKYGLATTVYTTFFSTFVLLFQISSNRLSMRI